MWALQGRFENGFVELNKGEWNTRFMDELFQFPDPLTHDDLVDALAYVDQFSAVSYAHDTEFDDYIIQDLTAGY
jgi:phage terminase large subunit-like protein